MTYGVQAAAIILTASTFSFGAADAEAELDADVDVDGAPGELPIMGRSSTIPVISILCPT